MYDWLKMAYPKKMATLEQCKMAVVKGKITVVQYEEITGVMYV